MQKDRDAEKRESLLHRTRTARIETKASLFPIFNKDFPSITAKTFQPRDLDNLKHSSSESVGPVYA